MIIGSAIGGAVMFIIIVFLTLVTLIIAVSIANHRKSKVNENHTLGI